MEATIARTESVTPPVSSSSRVLAGRIVEMQVSSGQTLERLRPVPMEDR